MMFVDDDEDDEDDLYRISELHETRKVAIPKVNCVFYVTVQNNA
jgi:hypothetical protein